jgi:membrane-associated phospholipid phosphatase
MAWRMRHQLVLKFLGISGFMWVFFTLYFHLLRHPGRAVLVMPLTALDRAIPFQPAAFLAYASLWLYVGFPVGLMLSLREAARYGAWMGSLCAVGLACFYAWPTAVPPYDFSGVDLGHSGMALLQGVDAAGNACPSLHVATAIFTAVWVHRLLQLTGAHPLWFVANAVWAALIVYSTLAIKQHVALDVVAGAVLALAFAWPSVRWHPPAVR